MSEKRIGSHAEVWHGTAHHTSGGLTKADLMKNKNGRIISKKKYELGKKMYRLNKAKMAYHYKKATPIQILNDGKKTK